jgi:hypothetical protein
MRAIEDLSGCGVTTNTIASLYLQADERRQFGSLPLFCLAASAEVPRSQPRLRLEEVREAG